MAIDKQHADTNRQDHAHQEGQQNNTPASGAQRSSGTQTRQMGNMKNESEEQRRGRGGEQKDEGGFQQEERRR